MVVVVLRAGGTFATSKQAGEVADQKLHLGFEMHDYSRLDEKALCTKV